jgi:flagellar basal-body rod protein FlgB
MIEAVFRSDNYQIAKAMLDANVLRHEAIAANIANAETPGYRRVDLAPDFSAKLQHALKRGAFGHGEVRPTLVEDSTARAVRPDGNNVEIEKELVALSRNNTEHQFLSQVVTGNLRSLRLAITGRQQ